MKPSQQMSIFWFSQCRDKNVCGACPRKYMCSWMVKELLNGTSGKQG